MVVIDLTRLRRLESGLANALAEIRDLLANVEGPEPPEP